MTTEVFELELCGAEIERRYRTLRPEVEEMPWGTLDPASFEPELLLAARRSWTGAAFQEYRTGAACAATLRALIEARAPLDLIAVASRFPLDEMVHVELCSRVAMELGGAIELVYETEHLVAPIATTDNLLLNAAHLVVSYFCVGEALSIPLLHGTSKSARHPLTKAVLQRIVKDEADHGTFGWAFLDWASPHLSRKDLDALAVTARQAIAEIHVLWDDIRKRPSAPPQQIHDLGWLATDEYLALAHRAMDKQVLAPLRARDIHP
jgi:hypothetical protein